MGYIRYESLIVPTSNPKVMKRSVIYLFTILLVTGSSGNLFSQISPEQKLTPVKAEASARFGNTLATDQARLLVTAPYAQATYIYRLENNQLVEEATLPGINRLADFDAAKGYGLSAAIDNQFAAVGASEATIGEMYAQGQIQLFSFNGKKWKLDQVISPAEPDLGGNFGQSIGLKGNLLVTGAPGFDDRTGRGYIYELENGTWTEQAVDAPGTTKGAKFGGMVAVSNNMVAISAPNYKVGGNPLGAVFIYTKNENGEWVVSQQMTSTDGAWYFGKSITMSENFLAIGAKDRVCIFEKRGNQWRSIGMLINPAPEYSMDFGKDLKLSPDENFLAVGGDGLAYLFQREQLNWNLAETYRNISSNGFGSSNVFLGNRLLINAPWEVENGIKAGSVFFYRIPEVIQLPEFK